MTDDVQSDVSEDGAIMSNESQGGESETYLDDTEQEDADVPEGSLAELPPESPLPKDTSDASSNSDDSGDSPTPPRRSLRNRTKKVTFTYDEVGGNPTLKR